MFFLTLVNHFQSQEDIDKKEGGVFICHIPWKISQFGEFRVSKFFSYQGLIVLHFDGRPYKGNI